MGAAICFLPPRQSYPLRAHGSSCAKMATTGSSGSWDTTRSLLGVRECVLPLQVHSQGGRLEYGGRGCHCLCSLLTQSYLPPPSSSPYVRKGPTAEWGQNLLPATCNKVCTALGPSANWHWVSTGTPSSSSTANMLYDTQRHTIGLGSLFPNCVHMF